MSIERPALIVLDVNETLSDLSPLRQRFEDVGLEAHETAAWFAGVLRDGFGLTVVGENPAFADLATEGLRIRLLAAGVEPSQVEDKTGQVMEGFGQLPVHPDVVEGLRALRGLGIRLVTLTNGATSVADALLRRAGARDEVEALLSVSDAPAWKPAASAYAYAMETCGVRPAEAMLVAVHPWDVDGAARAGLRTAWLDRKQSRYPSYAAAPEVTATDLLDLAAQLSAAR